MRELARIVERGGLVRTGQGEHLPWISAPSATLAIVVSPLGVTSGASKHSSEETSAPSPRASSGVARKKTQSYTGETM